MRVSCIYHRDQQITNFCKDQNCLMPLCPSCIAQHTFYHEKEQSRPQYTSLFQAQAEVHAQLSSSIQEMESDKTRNRNLLMSIQSVPERIHEKIEIAKKMAYEAVDNAFINLQNEVLAKLQEMHDDKGLYSIDKSQKIQKQITNHLDQLYSLQEGLRGERGLSNLIYFLRQKQQEVQKFHIQTSTYLNANQSYYPTIEINSEAFYSLNAIVSRAIKIANVDRKILGESNLTRKSRIHKGDESSRNLPVKLRQQNVPLIQSQMVGYSPIRPSPNRTSYSPFKSRVKGGTKSKYDGDYENLSRKVVQMRQQNERLTKYLNYQ